ncbi:MAG: bifunctional phosphopantothenoylcysteine decarboxylase/phosphopantothenate--cysteine ligase CoaBC [Bacteroidales bacterium]|nr:bifunctional phosphopantothenoylcysteine decarboxylase/phosphopantothenate--cysteine ligase CoaBC [Bacteroidales bacterium]
MLSGKKILLGITGSIAAYKIPYLIRMLRKEGAEVQVLLSPFAREFVTPLTLFTLSNREVLTEFHDPKNGKWHSHIDLALWADLMILAPLTANSMAKMVNGQADNLLMTTYLSARCPVLFAPAMDLDMYKHHSTQGNIRALQARGHVLIAPTEGELASGLCGEGRMEEPEKIFETIKTQLKKKESLTGKKVLITAGPTYEAMDPVRFIGNHSTGLMGYSIARSFAERGAEVFLVSGPTNLHIDHPNVYRIDINTAEEMYKACLKLYDDTDIAVLSAAVADFRPILQNSEKIKKKDKPASIELENTKDILAELGKQKKDQVLVGFALETEDELSNAKKKIKNKNLDFIVLNSLKDKGAGFRSPTNKITILDKMGNQKKIELKAKQEVAEDIVDEVLAYLNI